MKITQLNSLLAAMLLTAALALTACGGDDDEPVTTPTPSPTTPTETPQGSDEDKPQTPAAKACEGWPADYAGVMMQAFWWDSYADSKWTQLTAQADELSQYFQLLWVPNSGKTSEFYHTGRQTMGYDPCFWLDHNSCWGTEAELRQMISTLKEKGTGVIEDVVINHKNGLNTWVDFPDETNGAYTLTWDRQEFSAICANDECNTTDNLPKWSNNSKKTTGASDTGDNFDGYRDLDHTNQAVQRNVDTYLKFLLEDLGYVGFRYDMVKGYAAKYTGQYNATAQPRFSVGECWDAQKSVVVNWLQGTRKDGQIQSAAFDFPLKYHINAAFAGGDWKQLANAVLANDRNYQRYAVTFIDNHDTYRENTRLRSNVCAANAFILCMPGTPCLFLKHWQTNKGTLKRLIALRRAAGITNQSEITQADSWGNGFFLRVKGKNGQLLLALGNADIWALNESVVDYVPAVTGKNFKVYAEKTISLAAVKAIAEGDAEPEDAAPTAVPAFCTVENGEVCAFFEAPATWGDILCWAWDDTNNYTGGTWPGARCSLAGTAANGKKVWKWTYNGTLATRPAYIIFNDGLNRSQTADLLFSNGGYYTDDGLQAVVQ